MQVFISLTRILIAEPQAQLISPTGSDNGLFTDVGLAAIISMNLGLGENAGLPIGQVTVVDGIIYQPKVTYRLGWFKGEATAAPQTAGACYLRSAACLCHF